MESSSRRVANRASERQQLLEMLRRTRQAQGGGAPARAPTAPPPLRPFELIGEADRRRLPSGVVDAYPVTQMQAGMMYHMQLSPDYLLYQNVDSWHLRAPFDAQTLYEAVQRVVARHDVLRTSFDLATYSEPLQLVHETAEMAIAADDLRHLPASAQDETIAAYVEGEKRCPFDAAVPPLLRFRVHRRSPEAFQFTLTEFHPILDGWSLQLTLDEILAAYAAALAGQPPPPAPPLNVRFRDYVRLEREALANDANRRYWSDYLAGYKATDLPRWPSRFRGRGARPVRRAAGS